MLAVVCDARVTTVLAVVCDAPVTTVLAVVCDVCVLFLCQGVWGKALGRASGYLGVLKSVDFSRGASLHSRGH